MTVAEHRPLAQLGARLCRILQDTPCAKRQCTPQSASPTAPLAGEPLGRPPPRKASPERGGGCAAGADGGLQHLAPQISFRVAGGGRPPHAPAPGGPMIFVCPQGLRRRKVHGTMQASSPTQHGSRLCRILQDTPCAKRQCTPQSASPPAPLAGEPMGRLPPIKPPLQGEVDAPQAQTEGCGILPRKYLSGSRGAADRRTPLRRGADDFRLPVRFALAQGPRDDASIVPCAARIKALLDFAGHSLRKVAMHPSVGFAASSPYRGAFGRRPPPQIQQKPAPGRRVPCRGRGCVCFWVRGDFPARSGAY